MPAVTFDPVKFKARYPEFTAVSNDTLAAYFSEAGLYLSNADDSPVQDLERRATFLNMLTAHIGALSGILAADGKPLPVGRVASGSEGSVSVSFQGPAPGSGDWFMQTQYGAAFWQATVSLRRMRYIPCPTRY